MKHRATWAELDRLTVRGLFSAVFFVIMVHYRWNVVRMLVPGLIARERNFGPGGACAPPYLYLATPLTVQYVGI